jgi:N-formylglutamate amidohydrolase
MRLPFVISLPHCSARIPEALKPGFLLSEEEIQESTDIGTKEIFGPVPGVAVLYAEWSRLVVDLNRDVHQQGPKGVIPQVDYFSRPVYGKGFFPNAEERAQRLESYYRPYHSRLAEALRQPEVKVLFDCHSLNGFGPPEAPDYGKKRPDIILGNNGNPEGGRNSPAGGTTCPEETFHFMKEAFIQEGFSVSGNFPYAGGFVTIHYGSRICLEGKAAVQIEMNQDLFLIPGTLRPDPPKLLSVRQKILRVMEKISAIFT